MVIETFDDYQNALLQFELYGSESDVQQFRAQFPEFATQHNALIAARNVAKTPVITDSFERETRTRIFEKDTPVRSCLSGFNGLSGTITYVLIQSDGPLYLVQLDYFGGPELYHTATQLVLADEACQVPGKLNIKIRVNKEQSASHACWHSDRVTADLTPHGV